MYFSDKAKEISAKIKTYNKQIISQLFQEHFNTIHNTHSEIEYFRGFFPKFVNVINSITFPNLHISCRANEIHAKPKVTYGIRKSCELGDYFMVVKYKYRNSIIGKKMIIFQFKRTHSTSWKIDKKQLELLKNWPSFKFGLKYDSYNNFKLRPTRPEFGSYVLIGDSNFGLEKSNLYGTAYDIDAALNNYKSINKSNYRNLYYCSIFSYFNLLCWKIGEPVINGTDINDFFNTLYRFMNWEEDPPKEFDRFEKIGENKAFWGVEVTIDMKE